MYSVTSKIKIVFMSTMASLCIIRLLWKKYRETKPSIGRHDDGSMEAIFWMPFESQHKSHISAWRTHVLEWEKKIVTWCGSTNNIFNSTTMHSYACLLVTKKIWRQIVGNKMKRKVIMRNWRECLIRISTLYYFAEETWAKNHHKCSMYIFSMS